jgi:hypothetical protein
VILRHSHIVSKDQYAERFELHIYTNARQVIKLTSAENVFETRQTLDVLY